MNIFKTLKTLKDKFIEFNKNMTIVEKDKLTKIKALVADSILKNIEKILKRLKKGSKNQKVYDNLKKELGKIRNETKFMAIGVLIQNIMKSFDNLHKKYKAYEVILKKKFTKK